MDWARLLRCTEGGARDADRAALRATALPERRAPSIGNMFLRLFPSRGQDGHRPTESCASSMLDRAIGAGPPKREAAFRRKLAQAGPFAAF
jgi:hypothetical protein